MQPVVPFSIEHARWPLPSHLGIAAVCVLFAAVTFARAGTLTTLDGKTYDGTITFAPDDTLVVTGKGGAHERIERSNVLRAEFFSANRPLLRGVILSSGEAIAASAITRLDSTGVRLVRPGGIAVDISTTDLAIVFFRPVSPEMLKHVPARHAGAVLDNGDFFEGDPAGLENSQVKISSILFGIQTFDINHQARAVILQHAAAPDADEITHLLDGSVLLGKIVSITDGTITIDDPRLGPTTVATREVAEISMGSSAFTSLSQLVPSKVDGANAGYAIDSTLAGVPMRLFGAAVTHGISQQPNVSLTWDLDGKYKSVIAKAGVPLGIVPMQRLQFIVLADGKEIFRSEPRTSVDDPTQIALSLAGVKTLTFHVETSDPLAPGATGFWADPILVRDKNAAP